MSLGRGIGGGVGRTGSGTTILCGGVCAAPAPIVKLFRGDACIEPTALARDGETCTEATKAAAVIATQRRAMPIRQIPAISLI
jgi:hypothetical protein